MIRNWVFSVVSVCNTGRLLWVRTEGNFLDREVMAEWVLKAGMNLVMVSWGQTDIKFRYTGNITGGSGAGMGHH